MKVKSDKTVFIREIQKYEGQIVELQGWVMNKRTGKGIVFIILRDGSGFVQCIVTQENINAEDFNKANDLGLESSVYIKGKVVKDERQIGGFEVQVEDIFVYQDVKEYPISKKEHGVEFLMEHRHLWLRSRRQWAVMRVRNKIIFSIHEFFQEKGFVQMDSPIFTGNAVEGTSTLFETEFFERPAYLSQSGQLYGEAMAMAMGLIYTFGPTFRAEKSKTRRHLSEFWMIEPEMAFYDNDMNMDLIEQMLRFIVTKVLNDCRFELEVLERNTEILKKIVQPFTRVPYDDAVKILKGESDVNGRNSLKTLQSDLDNTIQRMKDIEKDIADRESKISKGGMSKGQVNFNEEAIRKLKVEYKDHEELSRNIPQWIESASNFSWGNDFGGSDETVITRLFDTPIMVYNWPKEIKAFYMKEAEGKPGYAKGVDVLAPEGYGEIVGGGERETDNEKLIAAIKKHELPMEVFEWYLDLRRFGSVPHAGFGLGLERLVCWICKLPHVRESIPFPRMMGTLFP
jgi:asparaginyl-tRNA synthetase